MSDTLKKPVHIALLRPTQLETLAQQGKIKQTPFGVDPAKSSVALPVAPKVRTDAARMTSIPGTELLKQTKKQLRLQVIHSNVPSPDPTPPCDSCKTSACCKVFVVGIDKLEYDSGLYGDAAIKLTPEIFAQLQGKYSLPLMIAGPRQSNPDGPSYYLEGKLGEACPFLEESGKCGIYDIRPVTCRAYSCVGDPRITEEIRQGTEPTDTIGVLTRMGFDPESGD